MMYSKVLKWLQQNKERLELLGIMEENRIENTRIKGEHSISVTYINREYIGQIMVWETGFMDIEVIKIDTEIRCLTIHCEAIEKLDLSLILEFYVKVLSQ